MITIKFEHCICAHMYRYECIGKGLDGNTSNFLTMLPSGIEIELGLR